MIDQISDRAKRAIFLARELASTRGASTVMEPSHLVDALVREDQGEFAARMPNVVRIAKQEELLPRHPFFSSEAASALREKPEGVITRLISISHAGACFTAALELAKEWHNEPPGPLHLLAGVLSQEPEPSSEIVKQIGISREAVIAANTKVIDSSRAGLMVPPQTVPFVPIPRYEK